MNILSVNTSDVGGGAASSAFNLFDCYRVKGIGSWMAVGKKKSIDSDIFQIPISRSVVDFIIRKFDRLRGREAFHYPGTNRLLSLPPTLPDIIHCHNLHGNYFNLRQLPFLSRRFPVILNLRDSWLLSGHCAYPMGCLRWTKGCGQCPDLSIYPNTKWKDATLYNWKLKKSIYDRSLLYITTPSQWQMDMVKRSMLKGALYKIIPNGIDTTRFRPGNSEKARKALGLPVKACIVLLTGHTPFKDVATMVKSLHKIRLNNYPKSHEDRAELLFLCMGAEGQDLPIGEGFLKFTGFIKNMDQVVCLYQAADIYIHAAHDESFGKTVAEAMACGKPVVVSDVGGPPEQVDDGKNGFIVPAKNPEAMAEKVNLLLNNRDLINSLGASAAKKVIRCYDLKRQADSFLDWYQEVVEDWKKKNLNVS